MPRGRKPLTDAQKAERKAQRILEQKNRLQSEKKSLLSPQNVLSRRLKELELSPSDLVVLSGNELYQDDIRAICAGNMIVDRKTASVLDRTFGDTPGTWERFQGYHDLYMIRTLAEVIE